MLDIKHEVMQGLQTQTSTERIPYSVNFEAWPIEGEITNPVVEVFNEAGEEDVTASVMPINSPTIEGAVVKLSLLYGLKRGNTYRVEVAVKSGAMVLEGYFRVKCLR